MSAALGPISPFNFNFSLLNAAPRAQKDYLIYFLILSALLHGLLLFVQFTDTLRKQSDEGARPLQVVLVNAKSANQPHKAALLAQANLDGGGNTDAKVRATSPFPTTENAEPQPELKQRLEQVRELEQQQARLLTQLKTKPALEKPAPAARPQPEAGHTPDATDLMARSLQMARMEAQIEREYKAYQERPKRHFIGARTQEYRFARYVEDWRVKVERVGNLNYPDEARQKKLYGSLRLTVHIKSDGTLEKVDIDRSSGSKILDEAAVRIVQLAAPYAAFSDDIRRDTDILVIPRTWTFTRSDQLASE
ncbi:MAG: energy transducer TonB [Burkholderiales bacterium]|nr:energy transducer TonB [Burkholderiales bacterium]